MRKGIIFAVAGCVFLAGCGELGNKPYQPPDTSKAKPLYHLDFDNRPVKPNPAGVTLPTISYTANTKTRERRAVLVVRFDSSGVKNCPPGKDRVILGPVDIPDTAGVLPPNYMDSAAKALAKLLGNFCIKGTAKVTVVLVRSSIKPNADEAEINAKRLSEWVGTDVVFKNPHPKC